MTVRSNTSMVRLCRAVQKPLLVAELVARGLGGFVERPVERAAHHAGYAPPSVRVFQVRTLCMAAIEIIRFRVRGTADDRRDNRAPLQIGGPLLGG